MSSTSSLYFRPTKKNHLSNNTGILDKKSKNQHNKKSLLMYPLRKSMSNIDDQSTEEFRQTLFLNNSRKFPGNENPENEYIKNLEKQIYFLELETTFLRDQSKKSLSIPSKFSSDAEEMFSKVQKLQENHLIVLSELNDKKAEIFELKNERELLLDNVKRDKETYNQEKKKRSAVELKTKKKLEITESNLTANYEKLNNIKEEFLAKIEIINNEKQKVESDLSLKKSTIKKLECNLTEREEKLKEFEKNAILTSTLKDDFQTKELSMKSESINLRQKAKQYEVLVNAEKCLNEKHMETNNALILENSELYQKLIDQQTDFDKEISRIQSKKDVNEKLQINIDNMKSAEEDLRNQLSIKSKTLIDTQNKYKDQESKLKEQNEVINQLQETINDQKLNMEKKCADWKEFENLAKKMNNLSNSLNM